MRKYSFAWVTGVFFLISLLGHWTFAWFAFVQEQLAHGEPPEFGAYLIQVSRDTFENWQSEFLQLIWQVVGLAYLYYAGSPQSRGDDERMEGKLDLLVKRIAPDEAEALIADLEKRYPKK